MHDRPLELLASERLRNVFLCFVDPAGQLRGKLYSKDKVLKSLEKGGEGYKIALPSLGLDYADIQHELPGISDSKSRFGDLDARLDPDSLRPIPWADETQNVVGFLELMPEHGDYCGRSLCRKILEQARSMDLSPVFGMEWEFTLLRETPASVREKNFANLTAATHVSSYNLAYVHFSQQPVYKALTRAADTMGLRVEAWHEEMAPGFMEAVLAPGRGIGAVDDAVLLKLLIKKTASDHGALAAFMACWNDDVDGQGGHIHMSLEDTAGQAVFAMEGAGRDKFDHFIGGLQAYAHDMLPMFAPNVNSYRRFRPGIFAPVDTSWAWDGRMQTFRAIGPAAQRIENRLPGADCNPYHAIAATAAAGILGIENAVQPSAEGTALGNTALPNTLEKAAEAFGQSQRARDLFGEKFVEMLSIAKTSQAQFFSRPVTDVEKRYLLEFA